MTGRTAPKSIWKGRVRMFGFELEGLDEIGNALDDIPEAILAGGEVGVGKGLRRIIRVAKPLAPVKTGDLRRSFGSKVERTADGVEGTAYNVSDHAEYVELGTGRRGAASPSPPKSPESVQYSADWPGMDAQPFLYPALKLTQRFVKQDIADAIQTEVDSHGAG